MDNKAVNESNLEKAKVLNTHICFCWSHMFFYLFYIFHLNVFLWCRYLCDGHLWLNCKLYILLLLLDCFLLCGKSEFIPPFCLPSTYSLTLHLPLCVHVITHLRRPHYDWAILGWYCEWTSIHSHSTLLVNVAQASELLLALWEFNSFMNLISLIIMELILLAQLL